MKLQKVQDKFNEFIRFRDCGSGLGRCISCDTPIQLNNCHASHYFSAGNYKSLRFDEDNCHASCIKYNTHLSGNLLEYRKRLINKIGLERLEKLELKAAASKRTVWKPMKFELEYIYNEYKNKLKELKKLIKHNNSPPIIGGKDVY